ncbi:MAG: AMP-binding protein, partial [Paludibacteraceae bacterium]|nr:AMP-binding protein [Paludibacteraceae bacterium]
MQTNWDGPAFTDFGEKTSYTYGEIAILMEKLRLVYEACGVKKGDKIAFCGVNSSNWGVSYLSILAYGAVGVSILPDFTGTDIENLVNHSEAKILMAGPMVAKKIKAENMPNLRAIITYMDFNVMYAKDDEVEKAILNMDKMFAEAHPNGYTAKDVHYQDDNLDDLALINYTSGSTGNPKGVMLTYRSLSTNVTFGHENIPNDPSKNIVSLLPLAHMFGMAFEFLYQVAGGTHVFFIPRMSVPTLMKAFKECQPYLIFMVPLIIEKIYQKKLRPRVRNPFVRMIWNMPIFGKMIKKKVYDGLMDAFGGKVESLIIGGAALSAETEKCLKDIGFPFLVGYGMTECGPLIGYTPWSEFIPHSCGKIVDRMEIRIDSRDPQNVVGEIQVKGEANMTGYYKNEEATKAVFTEDGWLKTGDLGVIDAQGNIFIRGRIKNMLLGSNGQNIYPEEVEDVVNGRGGILESVVVMREGKLVALVYPDEEYDRRGRSLEEMMALWKQRSNRHLPSYSQIA